MHKGALCQWKYLKDKESANIIVVHLNINLLLPKLIEIEIKSRINVVHATMRQEAIFQEAKI
jgi:hypothetical protein